MSWDKKFSLCGEWNERLGQSKRLQSLYLGKNKANVPSLFPCIAEGGWPTFCMWTFYYLPIGIHLINYSSSITEMALLLHHLQAPFQIQEPSGHGKLQIGTTE